MAAETPPLPQPPCVAPDWALFLDVDGTLLDFAAAPADVHVEPGLVDALAVLHRRLDGALALISGRTLAQLDRLFSPLKLPAVGLHGLEQRDNGHLDLHRRAPALDAVLAAAQALAAKYPGALAEDKGTTIALHWRGAPAAEEPLHEFATSALIDLPGYHLQPGNSVIELRPDGAHKGAAVLSLLAHPPFQGRRPVFVGDDLTDEHGFAAVASHGGFGVLVGRRQPSAARYALHDPEAVRAWLDDAVAIAGDEQRRRDDP
ncbi:trehalose-phosphatase [Lysobacter niastensis]|uniref:Trehalose 6-phosphate phosphatase n=1 Tax=Lysobacter niastensis TaxID=380629 RepID=A0ABS0BDC2_9GAMM|nr:trehalose-phosphatase [Lysobacter niastensis]MBF6025692.1 trehalose-phosphatase [Lysobacter niastensis]